MQTNEPTKIQIFRNSTGQIKRIPDVACEDVELLRKIFECLREGQTVQVISMNDLSDDESIALSLVETILQSGAGFRSLLDFIDVQPVPGENPKDAMEYLLDELKASKSAWDVEVGKLHKDVKSHAA